MEIKLNKQALSAIAAYVIILAIYILAFLIIPFDTIAASWICFGFTIGALLISLGMSAFAFKDTGKMVSKIYGYPIFTIGIIYAVAQMVIGILICVIAAFVEVPYWLALLLCIILLGAAVIGMLATDNVRDTIEKLDEELKATTRTVTYFRINISGIVDMCEDPQVKPQLLKLEEQFRYSDPVSSDATKVCEDKINRMLADLKVKVGTAPAEVQLDAIKNISIALNERNRICKANK